MVGAARQKAMELDPRAPWYYYGTARRESDYDEPGLLNQALGL